MADLKKLIEQELAEAREVCEIKGDGSKECAVAWDAVEELQAAASHQKAQEPSQTSLEKYCDINPEADECRVYEN
ncbi:Calvin cycle protein CP12 [Candidatus Cyanaurora vandensis]|uniref:Calvin cycle protein CP12 n=1 Tax=Candidatus Cyanaurora vandensis TaxID=2714958 RepID=UPI00257AB9AE|nr:Calvin cycle protein CP12 [Candidatus Cyanaurora vandensis]